jgi:hypothetical protein
LGDLYFHSRLRPEGNRGTLEEFSEVTLELAWVARQVDSPDEHGYATRGEALDNPGLL